MCEFFSDLFINFVSSCAQNIYDESMYTEYILLFLYSPLLANATWSASIELHAQLVR
jgi:hypothetical protein